MCCSTSASVGAAVSWIGIAWLSPFLGGLLYAIMGVNRVKRRAQRPKRQRFATRLADPEAAVATDSPTPLEYAIGRPTGLPSKPAISSRCCIAVTKPIRACSRRSAGRKRASGCAATFSRADLAGEKFHQALIQAERRGVKVRVLIDGIGGGYFWSGTHQHLRKAGVPVARFLHSVVFPAHRRS